MKITEEFSLAAGVLVISAAELSYDDRRRTRCGHLDYVVSRPRSRTPSRVVNQDVAGLLQKFREPSTIVGAVMQLALAGNLEPKALLSDALEALLPFIRARWLVSTSDDEDAASAPSLKPGELFAGYRIVACRHFVEDTELYQAKDARGNAVAVKLSGQGGRAELSKQFLLEADVLTHAEGLPTPQLIHAGRDSDRSYIIMSWCDGVTADKAARGLRLSEKGRTDAALFELCTGVLDAYRRLHERGILHGDIYPGNILVDRKGAITIIDFGLSKLCYEVTYRVQRKGVPAYYEPELAYAVANRHPRPDPTEKGEQYTVAAVLYQLITGSHYLDLSGVADEMLHQIAIARRRAFVDLGRVAWPELECVLEKALSKSQNDRYSSLAEFCTAFSAAKPRQRKSKNRPDLGLSAKTALEKIVAEFDIHDAELPSGLPLASITHGAAGVAYALQHLGKQRGDPNLLSMADAWACRAADHIDRPDAFFSAELGLHNARIDGSSVYYGDAGVFVAQAMVASALGDRASLAKAVVSLSAAAESSARFDLTLGAAGIVVACALLMDETEKSPYEDANGFKPIMQLEILGQKHVSDLILRIGELPKSDNYLGIAHGLAGMAYAVLLWSDVTGCEVPPEIQPSLDFLKAASQAKGRGLIWPTRHQGGADAKFMESWCHGSPGYIHLWTIASRVLKKENYLNLAEQAAWTAWEDESNGGTLCCGLTGRVFGLLNFYRHTGDTKWLDRAGEMVTPALESCARYPENRYSLFQGSLGAQLLAASVDDLQHSTFPLFERSVRA